MTRLARELQRGRRRTRANRTCATSSASSTSPATWSHQTVGTLSGGETRAAGAGRHRLAAPQPAAARRADQPPRPDHARGAVDGAERVRGHRDAGQPRPRHAARGLRRILAGHARRRAALRRRPRRLPEVAARSLARRGTRPAGAAGAGRSRWWRRLHLSHAAPSPVAKPAAAPAPASSSRDDRKAKGQARSKLADQTRPLRNELAQIDQRLAKLGAERAQTEVALASSGTGSGCDRRCRPATGPCRRRSGDARRALARVAPAARAHGGGAALRWLRVIPNCVHSCRNRGTPKPVRTEPVFPIILSLSKEVPRPGFDKLSPNGFCAIECSFVSGRQRNARVGVQAHQDLGAGRFEDAAARHRTMARVR